MSIINRFTIFFLIILFSLQCSNNEITNIEFTSTDHPISRLNKEVAFFIYIIPEEQFFGFSDDSSRLSCDGDGCNSYLVTNEEMDNMLNKLSDTNYFHWEFLTAVTPYPETDCNLFIFGKDSEGNNLDYMCTIGRGEETYKILLGLSRSLYGEARSTIIELANYYKH